MGETAASAKVALSVVLTGLGMLVAHLCGAMSPTTLGAPLRGTGPPLQQVGIGLRVQLELRLELWLGLGLGLMQGLGLMLGLGTS